MLPGARSGSNDGFLLGTKGILLSSLFQPCLFEDAIKCSRGEVATMIRDGNLARFKRML